MEPPSGGDRSPSDARRGFLQTALAAMGYGTFVTTLYPNRAQAKATAPKSEPSIGTSEILKGLDGMSRTSIKGRNPFVDAHNAAAVIASGFFCREQEVPAETQEALKSFIERRLFKNPIYQHGQPEEDAGPDLIEGLVVDLRAGIPQLRRSGHNIIL